LTGTGNSKTTKIIKRIRAHFRRSAPETGLSACIFFAFGKKGYRFYPLRGRKRRRTTTEDTEFHGVLLLFFSVFLRATPWFFLNTVIIYQWF
jgi:hypothetical protein